MMLRMTVFIDMNIRIVESKKAGHPPGLKLGYSTRASTAGSPTS
jgi:hypothetical protein